MRGDGFFLDLLDATLIADRQGKQLAVVYDSANEQDLIAKTSVQCLSEFLPEGVNIDPEGENASVDKASNDVWCLISCNALFQAGAVTNHWVPGRFRETLGDSVFEETMVTARTRAMRKCIQLNQQWMDIEDDDGDQAVLDSVQLELDK